jgi:glutathione S-transferase
MTEFSLTAFTTLAAIALYFYMGLRVGMARSKFDVPAPATTGHPVFERMFRVQMNTLEWMPIFLPVIWLCALYQSDLFAATIGLVWIGGRIAFMTGYTADAKKRSLGFLIQFVAVIVLFIGTIFGAVQGWLA